ncbi:aminotransferase [Sphingomonas sp. Leaf407]|uniref:cysteine desulfurase family protein n=1 Tax=unclassified Sphingomonas TaxID=196159 RepID=UPI0006FA1FBA|nr:MULTISPECIES: aminotransferase class V-fold PLP-dependent enzyme [unclassified Sphingomonas]KQN37171.1 aminotransferase [Sphingomonas sp. Leaf42]KQT30819.1 aminotransferase [Sphingomonas sp. Leaf407]
MRPEAVAAVIDGMARWANPSSPHAEGRAARRALEEARARIATALGWDGEVILTGGASEALSIALRGAGRTGTIVTSVEHDAVLRVAEGHGRMPVGADGLVDLRDGSWLSHATDRFVIQSANSETGVLQPLDVIDARRREDWIGRRITLLADCSQSAGKLPLPPADLIVVSAHKLGGPPGIGALLVRDLSLLTPTGGQEQGYRGGTENLPAALGFAAALEAPRDWFDRAVALRRDLDAVVRGNGGEVIADASPRIATIAAYRLPGRSAAAQLMRLDSAGFAVSAGSACSSGTLKTSHVLGAMGIDAKAASEVIRVSFGWTTTADEVERFAAAWKAMA